MWGKENAAKILATVKEVYDQHLIVKTQFENLKDLTEKALAESRRLNERLIDKIESIEKEKRKSDDDLKARIASLEARLNSFSESVLREARHNVLSDSTIRAAATDVVENIYGDNLQNDSSQNSRQLALTDGTKDKRTRKKD